MTRRQRIDDLTAFAVPEQPALSPDGTRIVYVLRTVDAEADRNVRALWTAGTRDGAPRQLTRGRSDSAPAWSPDGTRIAFLRSQDGPAQVWLLPADGGEPEQVTSLPLGAGAPVWSPDGTRIAFGAAVDLHAADGEDDRARTRRAGAPIVVDRLDYQADGAGLLRTMRRHLHVLDLATGKTERVTEGDWHAGDPAWSPDSTRLAFSAATGPDADLAFRSPVHVLDLADRTVEPVGLHEGFGGPVTWTADGSALLVVGTAGAPTGHAGLLRVPLDGGDVVDLAKPLDRNVMPGGPGYPGALPRLVDDGRTALFCVRDRGCTHLYSVPVDGGDPVAVLAGAGRVVAGLSTADGTAAVVLATPESFGEIVTVDLATGEETVRTEHGKLSEVDLFPRVEREFTISDGTVVHGWLVGGSTEPGPLLVDVHGGPHNAWNGAADEAHLYHQELAALGWTVLLLNPRGSDGYGERFHTAALGAWGEADAKDFLEPVDQLVAEGVADPRRLAVAGYSYGGFMTCYLTSRDTRFAAAVAGGVVSDLTSMAGTSDSGHFLAELELRALSWDDGERYEALSPMARVDQVRTPTLVLQGAADVRCPIGQAQQWHAALREQGVPTQLVLYPEGSHLFILEGPPSHRIDFNRRIADWVRRYAGDVVGPRRPRIDTAHWQRRLSALAARHDVPGAALGILRLRPGGDDELVEVAHGLLNTVTGVEATTDSVFQIGSISKVWTATVALQLVDEGLLDLDAPIADVLPELRLAEQDVTKSVTMRHLLTHTSGIDGDVFTDTGRGDDCLEKYVALLADVAQNHPIGATWSYCNSGFSLAGRVIERITGKTWDQAVRDRLFTPLGLSRTVTLPEEALLLRAAVGHVGDGDDRTTAPQWGLPRSLGPAGLITSSVADVLGFARMHLTGGLAPDGTRVLGEASTAAMAEHQADVPEKFTLGDSWGLGWIRFDWDGRRLIGHDGSTIGQNAFLRVLPEEGLAVVLLTNGGHTRDLFVDLYREVFAELAGLAVPPPLEPPAEPVSVDADRYLGTYERAGSRLEVLDGPVLRTTVTGPLAALVPDVTQEYPMVAVAEDLFVVRDPRMRTWTPVWFYALPTGERYLHFGVRATPKVG
ncbi:serine hydrolase [Umezawaea tangerina]|uniref:Dipeptidyl aminopeptidase/acylaminoacyl peptidase n=1 Tax=Umezawaea tangerina TaxID=84725 RepID=A0A2T0SZ80_9PSEU|nr:serine hydrolase [Umezawaea tangerina]PRY38730.1 dipeptidyl aminopeptidase/acylaminoacyl peptidase [Umezawaea tangerina]